MSKRKRRFDIRQAVKPLLIVLAVWLLGNLGFYFLKVLPKAQEYAALKQGSDPKFQALQQWRDRVESLETFLSAIRKAETDLATLRNDRLSTRNERMVAIHDELDRLCRQFNIDFETVTFGDEVLPDEDLDRHVMVVPLEGGYANLRRFLQAVEDSERFLLVERVALAESKVGGVMLQLSITLATYFDLPEEFRTPRDRRRRPQRRRT